MRYCLYWLYANWINFLARLFPEPSDLGGDDDSVDEEQ